MSAFILPLYIMSAWIPFALGQSSISASRAGLIPVTSVVASVAASRSSAIATTSSAATPRPSLLFEDLDDLTSCQTTEVYWYIVGLRSELYEISLFAIDADTVVSSSTAVIRTSAVASSLSPSSVRPTILATSSAVATSPAAVRLTTPIVSSSAAPSTALVGRDMQIRQSQSSNNITLVTAQTANEPYIFKVNLPAGRYYISGVIDDPFRTTARSNVFEVVEGADTSCLPGGARSTKASTTASPTGSSITGGVMQTPGSAIEATSTSSVSGGAIAGIVIGVIGGLAILGFLIFFCIRRRKRVASGRGAARDRFSSLPSASSQDGGEYGQSQGTGPHIAAAAWRRHSDLDEKGFAMTDDQSQSSSSNGPNHNQQNLPYANRTETLASESEMAPSLGDRRRQAGPPTTQTLTEKTSMQAIVGKSPSSNESSAIHSRSSSFGGGGQQAKEAGVGLGRSTSTRRKPVPSLGPELRGELERERKMSASAAEGISGSNRKSYSLVPDLPIQQS